MTRRKRRQPRLSQQDLRALGVSPGLVVRRIPPGSGARRGEQLFDVRRREPATPFFGPELTNNNEATMDTNTSEGER
jgi:hypothetical protein